jgi:flagellar biogenesis protein FliO
MFDRIKKTVLGNAKNKKIAITVGWVSLVLIILIYAAGSGSMTPDTDAATSTAEFNIGEMVFGTFIRLLLVLALIYGIFSIYRLFQKGNAKIYQRRLQVIDTYRFSAKQAVTILRIDDEELLVGLTDHSITLLKSLGNSDSDGMSGGDHKKGDDIIFRELLENDDEQD